MEEPIARWAGKAAQGLDHGAGLQSSRIIEKRLSAQSRGNYKRNRHSSSPGTIFIVVHLGNLAAMVLHIARAVDASDHHLTARY
jgi:hypothetical protein